MPALRYSRRWHQAGYFLVLLALTAALSPGVPFWGLSHEDASAFGDKILHTATFSILTIWFCGLYEKRDYVFVAVALLALGALIEFLQAFLPYRTADWLDLAADMLGIAAGLSAVALGLGHWTQYCERWLAKRND